VLRKSAKLTSPNAVTRGTAVVLPQDCKSQGKSRLDNCVAHGAIMSTLTLDKKADLAGPGIGDYIELEKILPSDYHSLLTPKETQRAIFHVKRYIEDNLCKELNLMMVEINGIGSVRSRLSS